MFERIHQLFRYTRISSGVMWCVWSSFANLSISRHISSLRPTSIIPITFVIVNFLWSQMVGMIFVRKTIHLATKIFGSTHFNHILAELLITDGPVVNTQEELLLAFLLERVRGEVLFDPLASFRNGARGVALFCSSWESRGGRECTWQISCSPPFRLARSVRTCSRRCRRPSTTDILCTVLWVPHRVVRTIRCFQLL